MKKILISVMIVVFLLTPHISANDNHEEEIAKAKEIIKNKIQCSNLTLEQLEVLGDYYMEQMHPGELHEIMDERMGGEGSASLRQVHINMGRMFYCGESQAMSSGMMNIMMGGNMMNQINDRNNLFGGAWVFSWLFSILIIVVLTLLIILLIKKTK